MELEDPKSGSQTTGTNNGNFHFSSFYNTWNRITVHNVKYYALIKLLVPYS